MHMEHCVHRENHFSEENNGVPANCLRETNPKQTSTFFYCETVPLGNNLIEQNHFLFKFPPCTTDDNNGLLKYTRWHKNYEIQCAYISYN